VNTYLDYKKFLFYRFPSVEYIYIDFAEKINTGANFSATASDTIVLELVAKINTYAELNISSSDVVEISFDYSFIETDGEIDMYSSDVSEIRIEKGINISATIRATKVDCPALKYVHKINTGSYMDVDAAEQLEIDAKTRIQITALVDIDTSILIDSDFMSGQITLDGYLTVNKPTTLDLSSINGLIKTTCVVNADLLRHSDIPDLTLQGQVTMGSSIATYVLTVRDRFSNDLEFLDLFTSDLLNMDVSNFFEVQY